VFTGGCLREERAEAIIVRRRRIRLETTIGLHNTHQYTTTMRAGDIAFTLRPCSTVYNSPAIIARSSASCSTCNLNLRKQGRHRLAARLFDKNWANGAIDYTGSTILTAGVTDLDTSLTNMNRDDFTHFKFY
jgi:hypothetical protein